MIVIFQNIDELRFELLDTLGEAINPFFNTKLQLVRNNDLNDTKWRESGLIEIELSRLLGDTAEMEHLEDAFMEDKISKIQKKTSFDLDEKVIFQVKVLFQTS